MKLRSTSSRCRSKIKYQSAKPQIKIQKERFSNKIPHLMRGGDDRDGLFEFEYAFEEFSNFFSGLILYDLRHELRYLLQEEFRESGDV